MIPRRRYSIKLSDYLLAFKNWNNDSFINITKKFEKIFKGNISYYSSGRDALVQGLRQLGLQKGDHIILSALNLGELVPLLKKEGYELSFVDVQQDTWNIDPNKIENEIKSNTKLILITHLFGRSCDMQPIINLKEKHNLLLFEDCAHSFKSEYYTDAGFEYLGSFGDGALFSFEANKPLSAYGGGMLVLKNKIIKNSLSSNKLFSLKGMIKRTLEEFIVRSPFYSIIQKTLFHPLIANKFESFYRKFNNSQRKTYKLAPFKESILLKNLKAFDYKDKKLRLLRSKFMESLISIQSINFQKIHSFENKKGFSEVSTNFYNVSAICDYDLISFRDYLNKKGFDLGIKSEVIDCCDKNASESNKIANKIVLFPIHEGINYDDIDKLTQAIKDFNNENH